MQPGRSSRACLPTPGWRTSTRTMPSGAATLRESTALDTEARARSVTDMQYTTLGSTGLPVSRLAFGAMTFTAGNQDLRSIYKVGAQAAATLVGRALEAGVNFFDTADGYAGGESEKLLGQALKPRRSEVVIATKVGFRTGKPLTQAGLSRRHILWSIDQSLSRLGT